MYNVVLFLILLLMLPKRLYERVTKGKYKNSLLARLSFPKVEIPKDKPVFWLHAVSLGETKAAATIFKHLKKSFPDSFVIITNTTETGHEEAKKCLKDADCHTYLPFDFSWVIKPIVKRIKPTALILVESDFWLNLIQSVKRNGGQVFLLNGQISKRSFERFKKFPYLANKLFSEIDLFCLQSAQFDKRFSQLGIPSKKREVTGNIKLDIPIKEIDLNKLRAKLALSSEIDSSRITKDKDIEKAHSAPNKEESCRQRVIVVGSTHEGEEELIMKELDLVIASIPNVKILLVPRHPERFSWVAKFLEKKYDFELFSKEGPLTKNIILVDKMGILADLYRIADVAIVAGSFTGKLGGHDVFEPVKYGTPVLFGKSMYSQQTLRSIVLNAKAGFEVANNEIASKVLALLNDAKMHEEISYIGTDLAGKMQGSSERSWKLIEKALLLNH